MRLFFSTSRLFPFALFDLIRLTTYCRFQAILGDSAETSGFKQVALCLSTAVGAIAAGGLVAATGFYNPFLVLGSLLVTAGSAMCMMMQPDASLGYT